ncbi:MAG: hypothetical protein K2Y31_18035, partial [Burkholderiales bacterium]|nr:hypothetical protein [Burkholderiales bacterium]
MNDLYLSSVNKKTTGAVAMQFKSIQRILLLPILVGVLTLAACSDPDTKKTVVNTNQAAAKD